MLAGIQLPPRPPHLVNTHRRYVPKGTTAEQLSDTLWAIIRTVKNKGYTSITEVVVNPDNVTLKGHVGSERVTDTITNLSWIPLKEAAEDLVSEILELSIMGVLCTTEAPSCMMMKDMHSTCTAEGTSGSVFLTEVRLLGNDGVPVGEAITAATKEYKMRIPKRDRQRTMQEAHRIGSVMPVIIANGYPKKTREKVWSDMDPAHRELEALTRLSHGDTSPFIVRLFGIDPMRMMLHMEPLHIDMGRFFSDNPRKHQNERAIAWTRQLLGASQFLYERGVMHGDIKPPNIMVSFDSNTLKIIDFGLSTISSLPDETPRDTHEEMTSDGPAKDTYPAVRTTDRVHQTYWWRDPAIMARVANRNYGNEVDTWAMGLVVHQIYTHMVDMEIPAVHPFSTTHEDTLGMSDGDICDPDAVEWMILDKLGCTVKPAHPATIETVANALDKSVQTKDLISDGEHPIASIVNQMVRLEPAHRVKPNELVGWFEQYMAEASAVAAPPSPPQTRRKKKLKSQ